MRIRLNPANTAGHGQYTIFSSILRPCAGGQTGRGDEAKKMEARARTNRAKHSEQNPAN